MTHIRGARVVDADNNWLTVNDIVQTGCPPLGQA